MSGASTLALRGGAADETFAMLSTSFEIPISIDGGDGVNTVDYSGAQGAAGQVSRYRADGDALDAVGNNHGTLVNGATFGPGRFGQAFQLDGVDDYVSTPLTVSYTNGVTFEAWISTTATTNSAILADGGGVSAGAGMGLFVEESVVRLYGSRGTSGQLNFVTGGGAVNDGAWHHVVGTWTGDTTANGVRLYVDGELVAETTALSAISAGSHPLNIGGHGQIGYYHFAGAIDEVAVYNRALSAAEVQGRFQAAVADEPSGPGVYVNLQTGQATGLTGGISNIRNVIGSAGDDILVGNGGNVLFGGAGRDLLIAGASASQLYGGDGDDILLGGVLFNSSREYLDRVMAVWTSADDYATRVSALRGGLLNADSVSSNGQQNTLNGEGEEEGDLFLGNFLDLTDRTLGEAFVVV